MVVGYSLWIPGGSELLLVRVKSMGLSNPDPGFHSWPADDLEHLTECLA